MHRNVRMLAIIALSVTVLVLPRSFGTSAANALFPAVLAVLYFPTEWRGSRWQTGANLSALVLWAASIWRSLFDWTALRSRTVLEARLEIELVHRHLVFAWLAMGIGMSALLFCIWQRRRNAA